MTGLSMGIDIGGTFTDVVIYDPNRGTPYIWKELTTPDDPTFGAIAGVKNLLQREKLDPSLISRVVHATTLFTNAVIERKGARTGLITTEGFRDVLEIGRERKYELYDIFIEMPRPPVPRRWRREVPERLAQTGEVEIPLDLEAVVREASALVADGVESIAVVFLHAYANPAHELAAVHTLRTHFPDLSVTASCEVAPEIREYERASTTAVNALIKPLAQKYLDRLVIEIRELGIPGPFLVMLSNGGLTHVAEAKRTPVQLLESGPAAGALAGAFFGATSGEQTLLAFDMGGTTAKASLVENGEPLIAYTFEAAREKRLKAGSGLPIKISTVELIEVGAGGGSIAHIDELGLLKVGPESVGSRPGPSCYGRGGTLPTVTDADLLLGYLDPGFFLGGAMPIDRRAAEASMESLMARTGLSLTQVAWGIHDIVNETMASAIRVHAAERGKDPSQFALLATGGAGPVHVEQIARKLRISRVICPPGAGVGSAVGLLMAPARIDRVASLVRPLDNVDWAALEETYQALESDAAQVLLETGADDGVRVQRRADMRYVGQGFEIVVALPSGPYAHSSKSEIQACFEKMYAALFGRTPPTTAIQLVNLRVTVTAPIPGAGIVFGGSSGGSLLKARKRRRPAYFRELGDYVDTQVYDRYLVPEDATIDGPAIIEERESTVVVGPGSACRRNIAGGLIIDVSTGSL